MKILVVYYSMYGHVYKMAQSVVEGAKSVNNIDVQLRRVPETLPEPVLKKMNAMETVKMQEHIPICTVDELGQADGVIFGTPTRFGNVCAQMQQFLDSTGRLWLKGKLCGKPGSVFTCSNSQHAGQETTILSLHVTLLHHGMIIAGLPYNKFNQVGNHTEICGCSPYGASTIAGIDGSRMPSSDELAGARLQGEYVAEITKKLFYKQ